MRANRFCYSPAIAAIVLLQVATALADIPTAFTFQGRLSDDSGPSTGSYDFIFDLYAQFTGGVAVATTSLPGVAVEDGFFTVYLDYGDGVFTGRTWVVETQVRPSGGGAYETLSPRQPIMPAPHAMYAETMKRGGIDESALADDAVTSGKIQDGAIGFGDIGQNGAVSGQIMKWNGSTWAAADDQTGGGGVSVPLELSGSVAPPGAVVKAENTGVSAGVYGGHTISGNYGVLGAPNAGVSGRGNTSGNYGYLASDEHGAYGENFASGNHGHLGGIAYGAYGEHDGSGNQGYLGGSSHGVYGESSSGHAGYFEGQGYFSGWLGVGTPYPATELDVRNASGDARGRIISNTGTAELILDGVTGSNSVAFVRQSTYHAGVGYNHAQDFLYLDSDGSVVLKDGKMGIGTTTPAEELDVQGNARVNGTVTATGDIDATDVHASGDLHAGNLPGCEYAYYGDTAFELPGGVTVANVTSVTLTLSSSGFVLTTFTGTAAPDEYDQIIPCIGDTPTGSDARVTAGVLFDSVSGITFPFCVQHVYAVPGAGTYTYYGNASGDGVIWSGKMTAIYVPNRY